MPTVFDIESGEFIELEEAAKKDSRLIEIQAATVLIKGDKGEAPKIFNGSGLPSGKDGKSGDLYLDSDTGDIYSYV